MFHLVLPFFSYLRPIFDAIFPIVSSPGEPAEDGGLERARARRGSRRALAAELAQGGQDHVLAAGSRGGNPPVFDGFYMGTSRGFSEYGGLMLKFLKVGGHPNFFFPILTGFSKASSYWGSPICGNQLIMGECGMELA